MHNCWAKMRLAIIISGQQCFLSWAHSFLQYDVVKIEWTQSHFFSIFSPSAICKKHLKASWLQ